MLQVEQFKDALKAGRAAIVANARSQVVAAGGFVYVPPSSPPQVNASSDRDNSAERTRIEGVFGKQAIAFTEALEAYNRQEAAGKGTDAESRVIASQYEAMALSSAELDEIARIDAHQGPGAGGGFDTVGEPAWVARLEAKLDRLLAR